MNLKIISAGAGSGKTYRLTSEMVALLRDGVRASGIIATTFTRKAAAELQERVRVRLLEEGLTAQADDLTNALIGTVHGLGVKLLRRFAYEAGVSPAVDIVAEEDQQIMFNQALATVLTQQRVERMEALSTRLGFKKREDKDWRQEVRQITDVARANNFSPEVLRESRDRSFETFTAFLGDRASITPAQANQKLAQLLEDTITQLKNNGDSTKKTQGAADDLQRIQRELSLYKQLNWYQWVQISKVDVGAKSRDDVADLAAFAREHDTLPAFHDDIHDFINELFNLAIDALDEYDRYKKQRGLIDYTDMEAMVMHLLDDPQVREVLREELDLLMVDEFQDTSPMQLEIFLKLSKLAKYSVWVGDPKQSIYGFRGAEPRLMQAIIDHAGGVKPDDIQIYSWRSREDIVAAVNAIFTKAFHHIPSEQVALRPKRTRTAQPDGAKADEPASMGAALTHWHFNYDGEGRQPGKPWLENCIAETLKNALSTGISILPKGEKDYRPARPGDVAILCRSNSECQIVAEALHRAGLAAAISRAGLLNTAEARLIVACLKYVLNQYDSLSVAELLLLAAGKNIEEIIENRMEYLALVAAQEGKRAKWAQEEDFVRRLFELRSEVVELSSAEILNLLLEELDLRRIIVRWGNARQRLDNVDALRQLALRYEDACTRLHSAASLGGFLLWLSDLEAKGTDQQGAGESPEAVNVLTYHRSKGLEWPIVVCHSLDHSLRADLWGIALVASPHPIDLNHVLANRWLRYWLNPYSDQYRNTNLDTRLLGSDQQAEKTLEARQEEARLLYVGLTRARDYLVFPTAQQRPTKWLNRVWHQGQEEHFVLEPDTHETPWAWEGRYLDKQTQILGYGRDFTYAETAVADQAYLAPRAGKASYQPYALDLKAKDLSHLPRLAVRSQWPYAAPLTLTDDYDKYTLAKAVKAFFTADYPQYPATERQAMAEGIIARYSVGEMLAPEALIAHAQAWHKHLSSQFPAHSSRRKHPIRHFHQGQLFETVIDLLLKTDTELILIQTSGFAGDPRHCEKQAKSLLPWFALATAALQQTEPPTPIRTLLHFVLPGIIIEVG